METYHKSGHFFGGGPGWALNLKESDKCELRLEQPNDVPLLNHVTFFL